MDLFTLISLLGGLALFLYGMSLLGSGLEKASGGRLEKILERLTSNILKSVLLGAAVTAAVQSSSATTVIIVGLVNAKILRLRQAIGVIMGANIGTTVTAHILRLADLESPNFWLRLLKPSTLAPLAAVVGIVMFLGSRRSHRRDLGQILLGFGILFTGMFAMEDAVRPLGELPAFSQLFTAFQNPLLGVLAGAVVTAVIQSSSASVGILQALSSTGLITYSSAIPIILGQNIGTCITPILASIGASKSAKRTALVHLSFNLLGALVFLAGVYSFQALVGFPFWDHPIDKGGIANFHTIFNLTATLLFLPLAGLLERIVYLIIPRQESEGGPADSVRGLDDRLLASPGLAIGHSRQSAALMGQLAYENYLLALGLLKQYDHRAMERLKEAENTIDRLESRLEVYLLQVSERELSEQESRQVSELLHVISEFERIGDYSVNMMETAGQLFEAGCRFSSRALSELDQAGAAVSEIIRLAVDSFDREDAGAAMRIEPLEEVIDDICQALKDRHIDRLREGSCTVDVGLPFVETLSNIERISDHCSNIGVYVIGHSRENRTGLDRHKFVRSLHRGEVEQYNQTYQDYRSQYFDPIQG